MSEQKTKKRRLRKWLAGVAGALFVLYLGRVWLISPILCRSISALAGNAGASASVGRVAGSYFGSVRLQKLDAASGDRLIEVSADEILVDYDLFALLFGGRIVEKISVVRPVLSISGIPEGGAEERPAEIEIPDLAELFAQLPDLEISDASLVWREGAKIEVLGFSLKQDARSADKKVSVEGQFSLSHLLVEGFPSIPAQGRWKMSCDSEGLRIESFSLKAGDLGGPDVCQLQGVLRGGKDASVDLRAQLHLPHAQGVFGKFLELRDTHGELEAAVAVRGSLLPKSALSVNWGVTLEKAAWAGNPLPVMNSSGACLLADGRVKVTRAALRIGKREIWQGSGIIGPRIDWTWRMDADDIETVLDETLGPLPMRGNLPLAGKVRSALDIKGSISEGEALDIRADFSWTGGRVGGTAIPDVELDARCAVDAKEVRVADSRLSLGGTKVLGLRGVAGFAAGSRTDFDAEWNFEDIGGFREFVPGIEKIGGDLRGRLHAEGSFPESGPPDLDADIVLTLDKVRRQGGFLEPLEVRGKFGIRGEWTPSLVLDFGGSEILSLEGRICPTPGKVGEIRARFGTERLEDALSRLLGEEIGPFTASLGGALRLRGDFAAIPFGCEADWEIDLGRLSWEGKEIEPVRIQGESSVGERRLGVRNGSVSLGGREICRLSGNFGLAEGERTAAQIHVKWDRCEDFPFFPADAAITADLAGDLRISGDPASSPDWSVEFDLAASRLSQGGRNLPDAKVEGSCVIGESAIRIGRMSAEAGGKKAAVLGVLGFGAGERTDCEMRVRWPQIEALFSAEERAQFPLSADLSAQVRVVGDLSGEPEFDSTFAVELPRISWEGRDLPCFGLKGQARWTDSLCSLASCSGFLGDRKILDIGGPVGLDPSTPSDVRLRFRLPGIEDLAGSVLGSPMPFTADMDAEVRVRSGIEGDMGILASLDLELSRLAWEKRAVPRLRLRLASEFGADAVEISEASALCGDEKVWEFQGGFDRRGSMPVRSESSVRIARIEDVWKALLDSEDALPLSGSLLATAKVAGSLAAEEPADAFFECALSGMRWQGKELPDLRASGEFDLRRESLGIGKFGLKFGEKEIGGASGRIEWLPIGSADLSGFLKIARIQETLALFGREKLMRGDVEASCKIQGSLQEGEPFSLSLEGEVSVKNGVIPPLPCKWLSFGGKAWLGEKSLGLEEIALRWQKDAKSERSEIFRMRGRIGCAAGEDTDLTAEIPMAAVARSLIDIAQMGKEIQWQGDAPLRLSLKGLLPLKGQGMDLNAEVGWSWVPSGDRKEWEIKSADISLSGDDGAAKESGIFGFARISGDPSAPSLTAGARFGQQILRFGPDIEIRDIDAEAVLDDKGFFFSSALALAEGEISCEAHVAHRDFWPEKVKIFVRGRGLSLAPVEGIRALCDLGIALEGQIEKDSRIFSVPLPESLAAGATKRELREAFRAQGHMLAVSSRIEAGESLGIWKIEDLRRKRSYLAVAEGGQMHVHRAGAAMKAKLRGALDVANLAVSLPMSLESAPRPVFRYSGMDVPFVDLDLDLRVRMRRIEVHNDLADIAGRGELVLTGDSRRPELRGRIEAKQGRIRLPRGEMEVTRCEIALREGDWLNPAIDMEAERGSGPDRVSVRIQSPPYPPSMEFSDAPETDPQK